MATKNNRYEKAAKKKGFLTGITQSLETKGNVKNTAIETVKDLLVGVLGGGIAGAAIGRASLIIGTVITGIGHYANSRLTSIFGVGMMAANGFQTSDKAVSGTTVDDDDLLGGVKERVLNFKDSFSQKLYLDKLIKSKKAAETKDGGSTNGVGEVHYFVYPGNKDRDTSETEDFSGSEMADLERIERKIAESGEAFARRQETSGLEGDQSSDDLDPQNKNY